MTMEATCPSEALLNNPDWTFQANKDMMRLPWRARLRGAAALAKERGDEDYLQTLRELWPIYLEREKRVNSKNSMQRL